MTRTRAEHLAWCKRRALEYLPHDSEQAFASIMSDLGKHDETCGVGEAMFPLGLLAVDNPPEMKRFIEGFN